MSEYEEGPLRFHSCRGVFWIENGPPAMAMEFDRIIESRSTQERSSRSHFEKGFKKGAALG